MVVQLIPALIGLGGIALSAKAASVREEANRKIAAARNDVDSAHGMYYLRRAEAEADLAELQLQRSEIVFAVIPDLLQVAETLASLDLAGILGDRAEKLDLIDVNLLRDMRQVVGAIGAVPRFDTGDRIFERGQVGLSRIAASNPLAGPAMAALGVFELAKAIADTSGVEQTAANAKIAAEEIRARAVVFDAIQERIKEVRQSTDFIAFGAFKHAFMVRRAIQVITPSQHSISNSQTYAALPENDRTRVLMFFEFLKALWKILGARIVDDAGLRADDPLPKLNFR